MKIELTLSKEDIEYLRENNSILKRILNEKYDTPTYFDSGMSNDKITFERIPNMCGLGKALSRIPFDCFDVRINGELKLRGCKGKTYLEVWYNSYYGTQYTDIYISMKNSEINIINNKVGN